MSAPEIVHCTYRVKPEAEETFLALLRRHWPTLRDAGLATDTPAVCWRGEEDGRPIYFEVFTWADGGAAGRAHETPAVMEGVWGPMGECMEERGENRPAMDFPHVTAVDLG